MTLKTGDDVYVLVSSGGASNSFSEGKTYRVDALNKTDLQGLVDGSLARALNAGVGFYIALLSQSGTAAPVATVIENGLSAVPVWARSAEGTYTLTLTAAFTANKTVASCEIIASGVSDEFKADFTRTSANVLTLKVRDSAGALIDGFGGYVKISVFS